MSIILHNDNENIVKYDVNKTRLNSERTMLVKFGNIAHLLGQMVCARDFSATPADVSLISYTMTLSRIVLGCCWKTRSAVTVRRANVILLSGD